jgi:hypothetical protein
LLNAELTRLDHMELHGLPSSVNSAEISQEIFPKGVLLKAFH